MKRLISLGVSALILAILYWKTDVRGLGAVFARCDPFWMTVSLGMVVPLTLLTALRLQWLMPPGRSLSLAEATKLILGASVLNMILPSKMGDLAKAHTMRERGHLSGSLALSLVIFEKASDMLSLLVWCVFGLAVMPRQEPVFAALAGMVALGLVAGLLLIGSPRFARFCFAWAEALLPARFSDAMDRFEMAWFEMQRYFWHDRARFSCIAGLSIFLWFLHLLQIWLFTWALRDAAPFWANLALAPLAILAGLMPLTFAGVGTRDAALIYFFQPFMSASSAAALGLLCTARYLLPALAGLPFLSEFLPASKRRASEATPQPQLTRPIQLPRS